MVSADTTEEPIWKLHDFRIAWTAALVNDTGDWVFYVALPVFVFVETGSGAATAALFVCQLVVSAVLGPVGGSLVDRWDLRRCLIVTNAAQAVTLLPLLAVTAERVWPAYIVMVAQAALVQANNPANVALIPRVVRDEQLTPANAALAASTSIARLVGAPLGGVLVAWGGLAPIVAVDAISFLLVAIAVRFIRSDTAPIPHPGEAHRRTIRAGIRAVRENPPLPQVLAIHGIAQIAQGGFVVLFVAFVVDTLGDDGTGLGVIRGTMAIGALLGSAIIARVARHRDPMLLFTIGLLGMGLVALAFWNAPELTTALPAYVALFALSGLPGSALSVGFVTTIQTYSPRHAIGRVTGLMGTAEAIGIASGSITAGALVDQVAVRLLVNAQAAVYLVAGVLAAAVSWRRRSGPTPVPVAIVDADRE